MKKYISISDVTLAVRYTSKACRRHASREHMAVVLRLSGVGRETGSTSHPEDACSTLDLLDE